MSMLTTRNSLPLPVREAMATLLNARLAEAVDLAMQAKQAHWTVRGDNFIALHELFDKVHTDAELFTDLIAERVAQLGGQAHGTVMVSAGKSTLAPYPLDLIAGAGHVEALADALAAFGKSARAAIDEATAKGDLATADLFTEITRAADKQLWLVEAHAYATSDKASAR